MTYPMASLGGCCRHVAPTVLLSPCSAERQTRDMIDTGDTRAPASTRSPGG